MCWFVVVCDVCRPSDATSACTSSAARCLTHGVFVAPFWLAGGGSAECVSAWLVVQEWRVGGEDGKRKAGLGLALTHQTPHPAQDTPPHTRHHTQTAPYVTRGCSVCAVAVVVISLESIKSVCVCVFMLHRDAPGLQCWAGVVFVSPEALSGQRAAQYTGRCPLTLTHSHVEIRPRVPVSVCVSEARRLCGHSVCVCIAPHSLPRVMLSASPWKRSPPVWTVRTRPAHHTLIPIAKLQLWSDCRTLCSGGRLHVSFLLCSKGMLSRCVGLCMR